MKLTIKEIADMAGVSVTTVSQIINNKGSRFSEKTRNKVLAVVEEYDYKPIILLRTLSHVIQKQSGWLCQM